MSPNFKEDQEIVIRQAAQWLELKPVFLDTETTGLGDDAQVCDLAVVWYNGAVLFDSLIKPTIPIPTEASNIHGISDDMVKDAPDLPEVMRWLDRVLVGLPVIVYNLSFDTRIIEQSAKAHDLDFAPWWQARPSESLTEFYRRTDRWHCAMNAYAQYYGDWNDYHQSYRWQKLERAARQCGHIPGNIHRARVDAELTRQVVMYMAAQSQQLEAAYQASYENPDPTAFGSDD